MIKVLSWRDCDIEPPHKAGDYLVCNDRSKEVYIARWMPNKAVWKFPSAAKAFAVTQWQHLPIASVEVP